MIAVGGCYAKYYYLHMATRVTQILRIYYASGASKEKAEKFDNSQNTFSQSGEGLTFNLWDIVCVVSQDMVIVIMRLCICRTTCAPLNNADPSDGDHPKSIERGRPFLHLVLDCAKICKSPKIK